MKIEGVEAPVPRRVRPEKVSQGMMVKYHESNSHAEYWEVGGCTVLARTVPGKKWCCLTCRSNACEHTEALAEVWVIQDETVEAGAIATTDAMYGRPT